VSGAAQYLSRDHLQSVTEVLNGSGALLARYEYDAAGTRTLSTGTDETPTGFTGHRWQQNGSLWLTQYRGYDSKIARWLSEDPAGMMDGPNLYAYVANSFVNYQDPTGLTKVCCRPVKGLSSRCHCWIILDSGQSMGAYRFGVYLRRIMNHTDDRPTPPGSTCSDIPEMPCNSWNEQDIIEEFFRQPDSSLYGPTNTSNTPVSRALSVVPYSLPSCATGRK